MPSYMSYLKQIAVCDASDDDVETWITVRGNHIPIMKGQSKGDAVKSFFEKKGGSTGSTEKKSSGKRNTLENVSRSSKWWKKQGTNGYVGTFNRELNDFKKDLKSIQGKGADDPKVQKTLAWAKRAEKYWKEASEKEGGYGMTGLMHREWKDINKGLKKEFAKQGGATENPFDLLNDREKAYFEKYGHTEKYDSILEDIESLKTKLGMSPAEREKYGMTGEPDSEIIESIEHLREKLKKETEFEQSLKNQKKEKEQESKKQERLEYIETKLAELKKVVMETGVSPEDFEAYEWLRDSGAYNMFDYENVSRETGLPKEMIRKIQQNYSKLKKAYYDDED